MGARDGSDAQRLRQVKDLIDRAYAERLDLDYLAGEAAVSRFHFLRQFRAAFGETPHQYVMRRRIERAKALLRDDDLTVTDICFRVGFGSLGSFSARFKALVGESPSAYRQRHRMTRRWPAPQCYTMALTRPNK